MNTITALTNTNNCVCYIIYAIYYYVIYAEFVIDTYFNNTRYIIISMYLHHIYNLYCIVYVVSQVLKVFVLDFYRPDSVGFHNNFNQTNCFGNIGFAFYKYMYVKFLIFSYHGLFKNTVYYEYYNIILQKFVQ